MPGKNEQVEQPVSTALQGTAQRSRFDFTPHRLAKLRHVEMAKNKEEKQILPRAAMQQESVWFTATGFTDKSRSFCH